MSDPVIPRAVELKVKSKIWVKLIFKTASKPQIFVHWGSSLVAEFAVAVECHSIADFPH